MAEFRAQPPGERAWCATGRSPVQEGERCWDEVTTCSRHNAARKRRSARRTGRTTATTTTTTTRVPEDDGGGASDGGGERGTRRGERRVGTRKLLRRRRRPRSARARRRRNRRGRDGRKRDGAAARGGPAHSLPIGSHARVVMRCGKCWKAASGGVPDGDGPSPLRYGGLWKNRRAVRHVSTAVPDLDLDAVKSLRVK